ncbi:MAG: UPF0178 protein [Porticoccaceae bacterium]|nr:MAG: UPF0178 protein [Porticoccaceae bacterium]
MKILVDADACPTAVREILLRAAERVRVPLVLVANHLLPVPRRRNVRLLAVGREPDAADRQILRLLAAGDLVVTADLPLAAQVLEAGGLVLTPRGERLDADNIGPRLAVRDFLETLRGSGIHGGGPTAFRPTDAKAFADALDRLLAE